MSLDAVPASVVNARIDAAPAQFDDWLFELHYWLRLLTAIGRIEPLIGFN
jgi:hypothetical protein